MFYYNVALSYDLKSNKPFVSVSASVGWLFNARFLNKSINYYVLENYSSFIFGNFNKYKECKTSLDLDSDILSQKIAKRSIRDYFYERIIKITKNPDITIFFTYHF